MDSPIDDVRRPGDETETLIGRIVDREATPRDYDRFKRLAATETDLWRTLALRHLDMASLSERVAEQTEAADLVEVAPDRGHRRVNVMVTLSGWAAVLILGLWWALAAGLGGEPDSPLTQARPASEPGLAARPLGADEHYRKYLEASFVLGELDPILLETEALEDGRYRIRFIRRIEEYLDIDTPPSEVVDDEGKLTVDPAELRP